MQRLTQQIQSDCLSGSWCNANPVTSSIMEAVSFSTPALESFFIRTVVDSMPKNDDGELRRRCREFVLEEASHTQAHRTFNNSLLDYLHVLPPGLQLLQSLLVSARKSVSLSTRLFLVVALEHFSTVLSKHYLTIHTDWDMRCPYAKILFEQHAREELGHRSVVFDLWNGTANKGGVARSFAVWSILWVGMLYIAIVVPWILHRKMHGRLFPTLSVIVRYIFTRRPVAAHAQLLTQLFSFARSDYHPDNLMDDVSDATTTNAQ